MDNSPCCVHHYHQSDPWK